MTEWEDKGVNGTFHANKFIRLLPKPRISRIPFSILSQITTRPLTETSGGADVRLSEDL